MVFIFSSRVCLWASTCPAQRDTEATFPPANHGKRFPKGGVLEENLQLNIYNRNPLIGASAFLQSGLD